MITPCSLPQPLLWPLHVRALMAGIPRGPSEEILLGPQRMQMLYDEIGLWNWAWVGILCLSCVTLGKSLTLFEPFPLSVEQE